MEPNIIRNSDGTFAPGCVANPGGENGHVPGWQKYGDRAQILLARYTPEELFEIASDKKLLAKQSSLDAMVIMHLARSIFPELCATKYGDDLRGERKELLDRIEGQPKAISEFTGLNGQPLIPPSLAFVPVPVSKPDDGPPDPQN